MNHYAQFSWGKALFLGRNPAIRKLTDASSLDAPHPSRMFCLPLVCPHCKTQAPLVYRGLAAYCSACGGIRLPLTESSVTHAGRTSKVGGTVARVMGWMVIGGGLSLSFAAAALFQALFPAGFVGWAIGIPFSLLSLVVGFALLRSGRALSVSGESQEKNTRVAGLMALAGNRGGKLTSEDAARALGITAANADNLLTALAKERPEEVSLEFDEQGAVYYRFASFAPAPRVAPVDARARVAGAAESFEPVEVIQSGSRAQK